MPPPPPILDGRKSLSSAFLDISDQYTFFFQNVFTKWPPATIIDDRKSPLIAFLAISINTQLLFYFFSSQNGCLRPFWLTENQFRSHFSSFQINTQFFSSQNGSCRPFWMTENHFRSHFSPFQINTQLFFNKMAAGGHFGWPKITFDRISRHFRSIRNFCFQNGRRWPFWKSNLNHFGWPKITFDRISRHFRSIHNFFFWFFFQNGHRRPFWQSDLRQK